MSNQAGNASSEHNNAHLCRQLGGKLALLVQGGALPQQVLVSALYALAHKQTCSNDVLFMKISVTIPGGHEFPVEHAADVSRTLCKNS